MKTFRSLAVSSVLVLSTFMGCQRPSAEASPVVAVVSQRNITQWEFDHMVASMLKGQSKNLQSLSADERSEAYRAALEELINEKLLLSEAESLNIPDLQKRMSKMREEYVRRAGSEELFQKNLAKDEFTEAQFQERLRVGALEAALVQKWAESAARISVAETKLFYKASEAEFKEKGMDFETAQPLIAKDLFLQRRNEVVRENLMRLRNASHIVVKDAKLSEIYREAAEKQQKQIQ